MVFSDSTKIIFKKFIDPLYPLYSLYPLYPLHPLQVEERDETSKVAKLLDDEFKQASAAIYKEEMEKALKAKSVVTPEKEKEIMDTFNKQVGAHRRNFIRQSAVSIQSVKFRMSFL